MSRYHQQNLTDGKLPLWRHGRAWWWKLAWEWSVLRPQSSWGISIGWGHASIRVPGVSLYLHGRDDDGFAGRQLEIAWHGECLWLRHPWIRDDWRRDDPWWRKLIVLPVVDWLLGRSRCTATKGQPFDVLIPLPEGSYRATATPETRIWRRRWYWPLQRRDSVWIHIPGGIPFSGKGENSWDQGDDGLFGTGGDNVEDAIANCVQSVLRSRRRHGYDSKGTGKTPAVVLNAEVGGAT